MDTPVFALDIGTRTVIGIVGQRLQENFHLEAVEVTEHDSRSMLDGQIHHVGQVAAVVNKVKFQLEQKTGLTLRNVAVAAAGRALKTTKYTHQKDIDNSQEITKEDVLCLEIEAVSLAQQQLAEEGALGEGINSYHCVGYSVINYSLEDNQIGELEGQYGKSIGVHIIATFLPRIVVDSLYSVLKKANLEMTSLTLEPIAASKVIIPPSMRQLNIALVDIGAGTSDIAVSKNGSITSYAMVPIAGDEITESLCNEYLLDFNEGERIKRLLALEEVVEYNNILGEKISVTSKEVVSTLSNVVDTLAGKIAEQILLINEKSPQAVFCIGGGSQFPTLTEIIASKLGLPSQRAAIKGKEVVFGLQGDKAGLIGPEAITPLGIAISAEEQIGLMKAEVNGRIVSFFNANKPSVADALIAADINLAKLHGRPGLSLTAEVNGEIKIIKGSMGTKPLIKLNGKEADMAQEIFDYCKITVVPGVAGKNPQAKLSDVISGLPKKTITVNGEKCSLIPIIYINGQEANSLDQLITDGAKIKYNKLENIAELLHFLNYNLEYFKPQKITYFINERRSSYAHTSYSVLLNNSVVDLTTPVKDFDFIEVIENKNGLKSIKDVIAGENKAVIKITVNNKQIAISNDYYRINKNGQEANLDSIVLNGDKITFDRMPEKLILADILNYLNFNTKPEKKNARLRMLLNQQPAQFTSGIKDGDNIIIEWK